MFLYLVQHAEARKEEVDPSRPLSEKGLEDIKKMASYLSQLNVRVHNIFHSNKLRAKQTAEALSGAFKPAKGITEVDGLAPLDAPEIWAERLKDVPEDIMLVGHLPHLSRLASLLLSGDANKNIVSFKMAGVVCLKRGEDETWSMQWMLIPDMAVGVTGINAYCDGL
ncbi:MAG: phosphohistidine phosphatase SixA [Nitrospirae bacterium]|nr:phosphohistidine phosphatase SixA [Nitrospirota bacterium]